MIIRIIDIGSNAVKASHYSVEGGRHQLVGKHKLGYSTGNAVFSKGSIPESGILKIASFVRELPGSLAGEAPHFTFILATSAVRSAQNRDGFTRQLEEAAGVPVRVLSGAEESFLIHYGILGQQKTGPDEVVKTIDIGGGSAEVSWSRGDAYLFGHSYELGAIRLARRFFDGKQLPRETLDRVYDFALETLRKDSPSGTPAADRAVGSSGNVRAVHSMIRKVRGQVMTRTVPGITPGVLEDLIELSVGRTPKELGTTFGLDQDRAQIIAPALLVLLACLRHFNIRRLEVTDAGLREGAARFWSQHGHLNLPLEPAAAGTAKRESRGHGKR